MSQDKEQGRRKGIPIPLFVVTLIIAILAVASLIYLVFLQGTGFKQGNGQLSLATVEEAYQQIEENYVGQVNSDDLINGAISGMTEALDDPYSDYLVEDEANNLESSISGSFEGIGAEVMSEGDYVKIVSPIPGSPAEEAGLMANDLITAIDGETVVPLDLNEAVQKIRGEKGTDVILTIQRGETEIDVTVTRDAIPIETVSAELDPEDPSIAYIKISNFAEPTSRDLVASIENMKNQGADKFILDVRGNPGGLLQSALEISNIFLPEGEPIVGIEDKDGESSFLTAGREYGDYKLDSPTVLLVDEGSASASEILAGALKAQGIPLLGQTTFGKGTVQTIVPITDSSELKITTAYWLTADGESIQEEGVAPSHEVALPDYAQLLVVNPQETYQEGQASAEIENINKMLSALGYDVAENQSFSSQTREAVEAFQSDHGLEVTGQVTGETASKLNEQIREKIQANDTQYQAARDLLQE